jgi:hypothetical protein
LTLVGRRLLAALVDQVFLVVVRRVTLAQMELLAALTVVVARAHMALVALVLLVL